MRCVDSARDLLKRAPFRMGALTRNHWVRRRPGLQRDRTSVLKIGKDPGLRSAAYYLRPTVSMGTPALILIS